MENLVHIDNSTIAQWQNSPDILEAIPCLRTYKAPERKVGCSKCQQKRACPGCAKHSYLAAKQCLQQLNGDQIRFLHQRLQANQIRFMQANTRGVEIPITIRLGRS